LAANVLRHQTVPHQKGDKCGQRTDQDSHAPLQPELHGGQSSGRNSWPHRPQRTLAGPAAPAGQVSPTRPPCSLAWPTRAGGREHFLTLEWVGGAVSREQQQRPACVGTNTCFSDRATWAADRRTESHIPVRPKDLGGQCHWYNRYGHRCHCTLAAGAPLEGVASPTRPAAWPSFLGVGRRGSLSRATTTANMLWP
jgi:hypothetical protein